MSVQAVIVLLATSLAVAGCEDARTEARPAPGTTAGPVVAGDRGAPFVSSVYLRDVRFDCAPNDAAAVTGRWEGPHDPVMLTIVDGQGQDHDVTEASPGPFVLLLRSETLPAGATVDVQARDAQAVVLDTVRIVLRYGPRGAC